MEVCQSIESYIVDGTESVVEYRGSTVGWVGESHKTEGRVFLWTQAVYFEMGEGYSMSEGLFKQLASLGVTLVVHNETGNEISRARIQNSPLYTKNDFLHVRDPSKRPDEAQYAVQF